MATVRPKYDIVSIPQPDQKGYLLYLNHAKKLIKQPLIYTGTRFKCTLNTQALIIGYYFVGRGFSKLPPSILTASECYFQKYPFTDFSIFSADDFRGENQTFSFTTNFKLTFSKGQVNNA